MGTTRSGLGTVDAPPRKDEDLLGAVFGEKVVTESSKPSLLGSEKNKKDSKVAKYFKIDKQVAKRLKLYAVAHETKEAQLVEDAIIFFLDQKES